MAGTHRVEASSTSSSEQLTWVGAPFWRDFAHAIVWTSLFTLALFFAIVIAILGFAELENYLWTVPVAIALAALLLPFTFMPALLARRVGVDRAGLVVIRFRSADRYAWKDVKPGFRPPRTWPLIGHRYPLTFSTGGGRQSEFTAITRTQADLVAPYLGGTVEQVWVPRKRIGRGP